MDLTAEDPDGKFQCEVFDTHCSCICKRKDLKQPQCLSMGDWFSKLSFSHIMKRHPMRTYLEQSLRHCADSSPYAPAARSISSLPVLL